MELNQERIEAAIIAEVADRMVGEEELYSRAKTAVIARLDNLWKEKTEAKIQEVVEAAISNGFDREYQRIDSFGRPIGEKTTIRAELEKQIAGYWNATVDKQGKPSTGYGDKLTRAEWVMSQMVAADFHGDMKQHITNLGGTLKDKLRGELHETVNRLMSDVFHVRSLDDQAIDRGEHRFAGKDQKPVAA